MTRFLNTLAALAFAAFAFAATTAQAAVDVNKADQAQLETVKGIGPKLSDKILVERQKGAFKDWSDMIDRVGGIGNGNAARFSQAGLTVGGSTYAVAAGSADTARSSAKADTPPARPAKAPAAMPAK